MPGSLCLPKNGAGTVHFLVDRFTLLGFEGQYWMLIVVAAIAFYILFVWKTNDRI